MQSTLRRAASLAALALTLPALLAAGPPAHAPGFDQVGVDASVWSSEIDKDFANGIYPVGGSGQLNGEFTIAERNDVQIGLRITNATDGLLDAVGRHGVGHYAATTGLDGDTGESPDEADHRAEWNYDIHVDLRGSATTPADYELTLQTDIADSLYELPLPLDLTFDGALDNARLLQISWNPLFGNDTFDPTAEGTYEFRLTLKPKAGGPSLSVKVEVDVTDATS